MIETYTDPAAGEWAGRDPVCKVMKKEISEKKDGFPN
jgi:hypothetical protein